MIRFRNVVLKNTRNMFEAALMSTHNLCLDKNNWTDLYPFIHPTLQEKIGV